MGLDLKFLPGRGRISALPDSLQLLGTDARVHARISGQRHRETNPPLSGKKSQRGLLAHRHHQPISRTIRLLQKVERLNPAISHSCFFISNVFVHLRQFLND